MFRTRFWLAIAVLGLTMGLLLATAGYGLYLRSRLHADAVAQRVSAFLQAPVQIGGIVPLDAASRGFRDVQVWLPGEFSPIFTCKTAVLRQVDSQSVTMDLRDGRIEARTDDWDRGTLGQLLATAFAHDFRQIRLKTIRLENMDLVVRRGRAAARLSGASGEIDLAGETGRVDLVCAGLNGVRAGEPVRVHCAFEPGERPLVRKLSLAVQRLGIEAFTGKAGCGLPGAGRAATATTNPQIESNSSNGANGPTEAGTVDGAARIQDAATTKQGGAGWFTGRITYRQKARESLAGVVELAGSLDGVDLAALGPPGKTKLVGTVSGTLDRAVLEDGHVRSLQGRLRIAEVGLTGLLRMAGLPAAEGVATLDLHELRYENGTVQALLAQAQVRGLDVDPLIRPMHVGSAYGRLDAMLQKIKIVNGRLEELSGEVRMAPSAGQRGTIDRSVLDTIMQRLCNVSLPPILPEQVPYTQVGARFYCDGDNLYIDGVAGPQEKFLLVVDVGSVPLPLVPAPAEPIAMSLLREQAQGQIARLGWAALEWGWQKVAGGR